MGGDLKSGLAIERISLEEFRRRAEIALVDYYEDFPPDNFYNTRPYELSITPESFGTLEHESGGMEWIEREKAFWDIAYTILRRAVDSHFSEAGWDPKKIDSKRKAFLEVFDARLAARGSGSDTGVYRSKIPAAVEWLLAFGIPESPDELADKVDLESTLAEDAWGISDEEFVTRTNRYYPMSAWLDQTRDEHYKIIFHALGNDILTPWERTLLKNELFKFFQSDEEIGN